MQAFFTVLLAAIFLRDLPSVQQGAGMTIAFTGLALIALTVGSEFPPVALALALAGGLSWAVGNVLVKHRADIPVFPLVVWCSLIPPLPALALSLAVDPTPDLVAALAGASWLSIGAALYLGVGATTVAYAIWGRLLQDYPTGAVAPFALIAPCTGVVASARCSVPCATPAWPWFSPGLPSSCCGAFPSGHRGQFAGANPIGYAKIGSTIREPTMSATQTAACHCPISVTHFCSSGIAVDATWCRSFSIHDVQITAQMSTSFRPRAAA